MSGIIKKYSIKIPNNLTVLYSEKKQLISVIGPLETKSKKLELKVKLLKNEKIIYVTSKTFKKLSNAEKKTIKALKGTTVALIKQLIIETYSIIYKKLKFVGVGYRVIYTNNVVDKLLLLKLGFSHFVYFKVPTRLKVFCLKNTKVFLYGNSCQTVTQIASKLQACKAPEPYKGKGIFFLFCII